MSESECDAIRNAFYDLINRKIYEDKYSIKNKLLDAFINNTNREKMYKFDEKDSGVKYYYSKPFDTNHYYSLYDIENKCGIPIRETSKTLRNALGYEDVGFRIEYTSPNAFFEPFVKKYQIQCILYTE